jgi:hypothetical protein
MNKTIIDLESIFAEFNAVNSANSINSDKAVVVGEYPTIHSNDLEPVSIIEPDLENGPWIAGGSCLRWFQDQPVNDSDIDVFCRNAIQAQQVIERIKSYGRFSVKYESENAVTLTHYTKDDFSTQWTIQVITRRFFNNPKEVIDNFDITVCQIGTTGTEWILGQETARDVREKNLRMIPPLHSDAPKRLTKYWTYGYRPVPGLLAAIQNNTETRWSFSQDEDYNNAF